MYRPTHLSLFVLGRKNGLPIACAPFYAEVVSPTPVPELPHEIDHRFVDINWEPLLQLDSAAFYDMTARKRIQKTIQKAISKLLTSVARDRLSSNPDLWRSFLEEVIKHSQNANSGTLKNVFDPTLRQTIEKEVREFSERKEGLELNPPPNPIETTTTAYPLGILATDHAGYLSFDLKRLPGHVYQSLVTAVDKRRQDVIAKVDTSVWFYALGRDDLRFDALVQGRFAEDVILTKLEFDLPLPLPQVVRSAGFLSMQNPSLTDWRLSPSSFASNPGALLGNDEGCENLLPANFALHEYRFYQVIGLSNDVNNGFTAHLSDDVRLGLVHEFRLAWYPLGHSLGQILYSLPLAPGESINLAVIDWTRRDDAQRKEHTTLDEQIVHQEHRDRIISETVNAAVHEYQKGSSFMGGLANSIGVSGNAGMLGLAAGLATSLGGSTAKSSGTRDIAANTMQSISDNITQASTAARELQSTVVVHSNQSEKETIETRTVVNYNHSHALTILYYEVLRHFRIVTELVRRRPAVLIKLKTDWFTGPDAEKNAREHRASLQAALLDSSLASAFDALERSEHRRQVGIVLAPKPGEQPPLPLPHLRAAGPTLRFFEFNMKTGGIADEAKNKNIRIFATLWPLDYKLNDTGILNYVGAFTEKNVNNSFVGILPAKAPGRTVQWGDIDHITLSVILDNQDGIDISFQHIKVTGIDENGNEILLIDKSYEDGHLTLGNSDTIKLWVKRPQVPPPPGRPAEEIEDDVKKAQLLAHLEYHKAHYSRAILFGQAPTDRAIYLGGITLPDGTSAADHIENRPLEIIGDYVAYPCTDPRLSDTITTHLKDVLIDDLLPDERLVTLPTRGVFAEAKLGHCNASEEIDNTRFWDWQQSPIPHHAPEIAPIQAVTPQSQQQNLQPTPFPQSLINIVTPPAAPDPTGLAAGLNVLGTPNLFRDMSGRVEVADLLKKLSDNTINIAEAANRARQIKAKYGSASGGMDSGIGTPRATPTQPSQATRDLHDLQHVLGNAQSKGLISPEEVQYAYRDATRSAFGNGQGSPVFENAVFNKEEVEKAQRYVQYWADLIRFKVPPEVASELQGRNMSVQDFSFAIGDLNLDYYPVKIFSFPIIGGNRVDAIGLLRHIRLNLNNFVDTSLSDFVPYAAGTDDIKWNSSNPVGAVIKIDIAGPDNASVVCSLAENNRWRFSTISTPLTGSHPVSGNREFGFFESKDGGAYFYTRGADRTSEFGETLLDFISYEKADKLWTSFTNKLNDFVNDNGGFAGTFNRISERVNWNAASILLRGQPPLDIQTLQI